MRNFCKRVGLILLIFGMTGFTGLAFGAAGTEKPGLPQWAKDIKNPTPWFDWGADYRNRFEWFPGVISHNPDTAAPISEWWRLRTRIFFNIKPQDDIKIKFRLANETRLIMNPDNYVKTTPHDKYDDFDETLIDKLELEWKNIFCLPVTMRLGRQDMLGAPIGKSGPNDTGFGDGFIFMDGTPRDGSRTFYFDAARFTIDLDAWIAKSSLDVFAMTETPYTRYHGLYPIGGDTWRSLVEWADQGYVLYFKNGSWIPKSQLDLYYIYKNGEDQHLKSWQATPANPYLLHGTNFSMLGLRAAGKLAERTSYLIEGGVQMGRWNANDRLSYGGQASIDQGFDAWGQPSIGAFFVYLSGDDPKTKRYEAWDPMWARWPKWGELIGYQNIREYGPYYFTNLEILGVQGSVKPCKNVTMAVIPQFLFAPENTFDTGFGSTSNLYGTGGYRGFYPRFKVSWSPTEYFNTSVLYEHFDAGSYFSGTARDRYDFFQWDVCLTF